jgi:hypothetical protein
MIFRRLVIVLSVVAASLATGPLARAECFLLTAKYVMEQSISELVFSGTVVEVTRTAELGYRATFEVDRIWKGAVSKRFDLYVWELAPETPRFEVGRHYVALAIRLTDSVSRQRAGVIGTETVAYSPVFCSNSLSPDIVRELGIGEPPK